MAGFFAHPPNGCAISMYANLGTRNTSKPHRITAGLQCASDLVGATGIEPARIAPKDPKSFASANSATRPDSRSILAPAETIVNSFPAGRAAAGAYGHHRPNAGFIRQGPRAGKPCRMNPAFRFVCSAAVVLVSRSAPMPLAAGERWRQSRSYGTYRTRKKPALPLALMYWVLVVAVGVKRLPRLLQAPPRTGANSSW